MQGASDKMKCLTFKFKVFIWLVCIEIPGIFRLKTCSGVPHIFAHISPRTRLSVSWGLELSEHICSGGVKRPQEAYELGVDEKRGRKREGSADSGG